MMDSFCYIRLAIILQVSFVLCTLENILVSRNLLQLFKNWLKKNNIIGA